MRRKHTYGQHFLRNPAFVRQLIQKTSISNTDTVYDIGAGTGIIASALAEVARTVIAIEYDQQTANKLRINLQGYANVRVIEGDFMTMEPLIGGNKVFANIPFHLSSKIVRKLCETATPPQSIYLIVQKQFAQKIVLHNQYFTGALGMMLGPMYEAKIVKQLQRSDYMPRPNVDTVLLALERRPRPLIAPLFMPEYRQLVERSYHDPKVFAKTPRRASGIDELLKPSQLSLEQWVQLFEVYRQKQHTK